MKSMAYTALQSYAYNIVLATKNFRATANF